MNQPPAINPEHVGRLSQIIVGALMMSQLVFGAVALVLTHEKTPQLGILSYLGAGFAVMLMVMSFVMRQLMTAAPIRQLAAENPTDWRQPLAGVYQTKTIVPNALLEGAGFFNLVVYLVEAHWMNLAIVGCLLSLMAILFPSQAQFESWADRVQRDHS